MNWQQLIVMALQAAAANVPIIIPPILAQLEKLDASATGFEKTALDLAIAELKALMPAPAPTPTPTPGD